MPKSKKKKKKIKWDLPAGVPDGPGFVVPDNTLHSKNEKIMKMTSKFLNEEAEKEAEWQNAQFSKRMKKKRKNTQKSNRSNQTFQRPREDSLIEAFGSQHADSILKDTAETMRFKRINDAIRKSPVTDLGKGGDVDYGLLDSQIEESLSEGGARKSRKKRTKRRKKKKGGVKGNIPDTPWTRKKKPKKRIRRVEFASPPEVIRQGQDIRRSLNFGNREIPRPRLFALTAPDGPRNPRLVSQERRDALVRRQARRLRSLNMAPTNRNGLAYRSLSASVDNAGEDNAVALANNQTPSSSPSSLPSLSVPSSPVASSAQSENISPPTIGGKKRKSRKKRSRKSRRKKNSRKKRTKRRR